VPQVGWPIFTPPLTFFYPSIGLFLPTKAKKEKNYKGERVRRRTECEEMVKV